MTPEENGPEMMDDSTGMPDIPTLVRDQRRRELHERLDALGIPYVDTPEGVSLGPGVRIVMSFPDGAGEPGVNGEQ